MFVCSLLQIEGSRILQKEDSELKRGLDVFEQGSHDESLEIKKQKLSGIKAL